MRAALWTAGVSLALVLIADCPPPLAAVLGVLIGRWVADDPGHPAGRPPVSGPGSAGRKA